MTESKQFPDMSVLVVDDSKPMRQLIHRHLTELGIVMITECESGEAAANALFSDNEKPPFDIILLDWHMGPLSGFELLKSIVTFEKTADIPVIMLTSEQKTEQVKDAIKTGAADYIIKPLKSKIFMLKLKRILNKKYATEKTNAANKNENATDADRLTEELDNPVIDPSKIRLSDEQRKAMEEQIEWVKSVFKK